MLKKTSKADTDLPTSELTPAERVKLLEPPSLQPSATEAPHEEATVAASTQSYKRIYLPLQAKFAIALTLSVLWALMAAAVADKVDS